MMRRSRTPSQGWPAWQEPARWATEPIAHAKSTARSRRAASRICGRGSLLTNFEAVPSTAPDGTTTRLLNFAPLQRARRIGAQMGISSGQTPSELRRALRTGTHSYTVASGTPPKCKRLGGDFSRDFNDLLKFKESLKFTHTKLAGTKGAVKSNPQPMFETAPAAEAPGNAVLPGGSEAGYNEMDYCNPFKLIKRHIHRYRPRTRAMFDSTLRAKQAQCDLAQFQKLSTLSNSDVEFSSSDVISLTGLQRGLLQERGLDLEEFIDFVQRLGLTFPRDVTKAIFNICDSDKDGLVQHSDFERALKTFGSDAQSIPGMSYMW